MNITDQSFDPVPVTVPTERNLNPERTHQGIPGIACMPSGRLFVTWYAGGDTECRDNFSLLVVSDDGGHTWSDAVAVIDPPPVDVRTFDPTLFLTPDGRLLWIYAQGCGGENGTNEIVDGRAGVWITELTNPDAAPTEFRFTAPRRIADGILLNKPTVLADGTWALPISVWTLNPNAPLAGPRAVPGCKTFLSPDNGRTFLYQGMIDLTPFPATNSYDEHLFIERRDGSLDLYIRRKPGVACAHSTDRGRTWSALAPCPFRTPDSRFFIGRLKSGRLLRVSNDVTGYPDNHRPRVRMTAYLSDDDGATWPYALLLDEREQVSYPDVHEQNGLLHIIYDRERYKHGEILYARIAEADILAGAIVTPGSRLKLLVDQTNGVKPKS